MTANAVHITFETDMTSKNTQAQYCAPKQSPYFDNGRYCRTGGLRPRDYVFHHCWTPDNRCNTVMQQVDMGGPLDAPALMPAGSVESISTRDAYGRPCARTSTFERN
ncbi:MAG: hypothetical protein L6Q68_08985 [Aquabacterium sp.]|nr:hypothetical protein [Aquabacterium sp.]